MSYDEFNFTIPTDQNVAIFTTSMYDTFGTLFNSMGNEIAFGDDYNEDSDFRILTNLEKPLNNGYTYVSLPNSKTLCDKSIQTILTSTCDENNTIQSVFGTPHVKAVFKYETQWLYWDNTNEVNASYRMNKFSTISPTDGVLVKTDDNTTLYLPYNATSTDVNSYQNMPVEKWLLLSNNVDQSVAQISSAVSNSGKSIMYILLQRGNTWYVYAPTNNSEVDSTIPRLDSILKYESYWIYLMKDQHLMLQAQMIG
jgi:hypothetical protein